MEKEFPQHFTWKEKSKDTPAHWVVRKTGWALGRMFFVAPSGGERFYLRTLLTIVKGPQSHNDLYVYEGKRLKLRFSSSSYESRTLQTQLKPSWKPGIISVCFT
jgi:hypothetical protein